MQKQSPEVFCKKGVLKNFANLTGKHLRQSLIFNKVAGLTPVKTSITRNVSIANQTHVRSKIKENP